MSRVSLQTPDMREQTQTLEPRRRERVEWQQRASRRDRTEDRRDVITSFSLIHPLTEMATILIPAMRASRACRTVSSPSLDSPSVSSSAMLGASDRSSRSALHTNTNTQRDDSHGVAWREEVGCFNRPEHLFAEQLQCECRVGASSRVGDGVDGLLDLSARLEGVQVELDCCVIAERHHRDVGAVGVDVERVDELAEEDLHQREPRVAKTARLVQHEGDVRLATAP